MTAAQVKAARYNNTGKFKRINDTLAYQELVAWHCKGKERLQGYVRMTAKIYLKAVEGDLPNNRGDLDNYHKAITDGLQYGGLFAPPPGSKARKGNDKVVIRFGEGDGIYITEENERVELLLEEIKI